MNETLWTYNSTHIILNFLHSYTQSALRLHSVRQDVGPANVFVQTQRSVIQKPVFACANQITFLTTAVVNEDVIAVTRLFQHVAGTSDLLNVFAESGITYLMDVKVSWLCRLYKSMPAEEAPCLNTIILSTNVIFTFVIDLSLNAADSKGTILYTYFIFVFTVVSW